MPLIRLIAGEGSVLEIGGEDLSWEKIADKKITGYAFIRLQTAAGTWLRIDAEPHSDWDAPNSMPRNSTLKLDPDHLEAVPGHSDVRRLKKRKAVTFEFHWRNPLTPSGAGLWFSLRIEREGSELRISRYVSDLVISGIYYATRRNREKPFWSDRQALAFEPLGDYDVSFSQFSRATIEYAKDFKELGNLFDDRPENHPWLVSAGAADHSCRFSIGGTSESIGQASYSAGLDLSGEGIVVSGLALGLTNSSASARPFSAQRVGLRAARRLYAETGAATTRWLLDWNGIPGGPRAGAPAHALNLQNLWSFITRHYPLGLAATRSRNRLTFVPTEVSCAGVANLRFDVGADEHGSVVEILLQAIGLPRTGLQLGLGGATGIRGEVTRLSALDCRHTIEPVALEFAVAGILPADLLNIQLVQGSGTADWAIGAVRLKAGNFTGGRLRIGRQMDAALYGQAPLAVELQLTFSDCALQPASQDPEEGFETLSAWLDRERPLSFSSSDSELEGLALQIAENADREQSRLLRIQLRAGAALEHETDVIVLDPSPLTVARVIATVKAKPDELIAEYTEDSEEPSAWEFLTERGEMRVILPPQSIGEEMIKGRLYSRADPQHPEEVPTLPFDFRLSPPARLTLDRTDINTARATSPWTLRRLMGRRSGVVGVTLERAEFELLYGMSSALETTGLRVAELDALVGRVPFADEMLVLLRDARRAAALGTEAKTAPVAKLRHEHARRIAGWIHDLLYRPSWWPVFRNFTDRRRLKLDSDIDFRLRAGRQSADPFEIHKFAINSTLSTQDEVAAFKAFPPADSGRAPLRGGVDWPFQSREIYRQLRGKPESTGGSIEGLAFGPLGGDGKQTAAFSNGKTIIISSTRLGRLDSVTLIRVGRVGMLWNHARHVIVYERTSRRAPRYGAGPGDPEGADLLDWQSGKFEGYMALRKVREYVEITQQRRTYPDTPQDAPANAFFMQSTFESFVIPVKASWGYDVEGGWVMPLRGPLQPGEEKFFPFPAVLLEFARAADKAEGRVAQPVKTPERLKFFTSTRDEDTGDTDSWPAWQSVDFSVAQVSALQSLSIRPNFAGSQRQPDAASADFGQLACTVDLGPAEEAANLMHGRAGAGIEAHVFNLSLARGGPRGSYPAESLHEKVAKPFAEHSGAAMDALAELAEATRSRADRQRQMPLSACPELVRDARALILGIEAKATKLSSTITANSAALDEGVPGWKTAQDDIVRNFSANVGKLKDDLTEQLKFTIEGVTDLVGFKRQAQATVETACIRACQRIDEIAFIPAQAVQAAQNACSGLVSRIDRAANELKTEATARLLAIKGGLDENKRAINNLDAQWRREMYAFAARLRNTAQDADRWIGDVLAPFFSRFASNQGKHLLENVQEVLRTAIVPISDRIAIAVDEVPPFELGNPDDIDWSQLQAIADALIPTKDWGAALDEALEPLLASDFLNPVVPDKYWRKPLNDAKDLVRAACAEARSLIGEIPDLGHLERTLNDAVEGFKAGVDRQLDAIGTKVSEKFDALKLDDVWKGIDGEFNQAKALASSLNRELEGIRKLFEDSEAGLDAVAREVGERVRGVMDRVGGAARHLEHAIANDPLVKQVLDSAMKSKNDVLALTRALAEGPVTDAMKCTREAVGYYFNAASELLDVTRASAVFNDLGQGALNALSTYLPFDQVRDRLLPKLANMRLGDILPDFGGLKLENLLPELRIPDDPLKGYDWIKVKHGFDKDRLTAWADVAIDKSFEGEPDLFILPPIAVKLGSPVFSARSRFEIDARGNKKQTSRASLRGNWIVTLSGKPIVTMNDGTLVFDSDGGFDFVFDSENIVLAEELRFLTDFLENLMPQEEGLRITPLLPSGISAELSLPLPDIGGGVFTLTGITLHMHFDLLIAGGFEIRTGVWLCKPERPFGLAVMFLGGGGWFGVDVSYRPPKQFVTQVSIGIAAGAFVAVNFGVARASAGLMFTVGVDFYRDWSKGRGKTAVSLGLLVWGEFSIMAIASASLRITLRIVYDGESGGMIGYGRIAVSIKICWCFTLRVNKAVEKPFKKGKKSNSRAAALSKPLTVALAGPPVHALARVARDVQIRQAVDLHFAALDVEGMP
jgi:hypothetical protein